MFLVAFKLRSDKLTDASYALSFVVLTVLAFIQSSKSAYATIAILLVCLWALRTGSFLLYRVLHTGRDKRFDDVREKFWLFGRFWLGQAITVWILMIPTTIALSHAKPWSAISVLGIIIWLVGFGIESIADLQKYRFTHNPLYKDHWIDSGVWHYSRHPNYFGEILVWIGIYTYDLPNLSLVGKVVGALSPLLITVLLLFISGIPILEKGADKRWGDRQAYRDYKCRTSLIIPLPNKQTIRPVR